jgi:general secretion pathway protein E
VKTPQLVPQREAPDASTARLLPYHFAKAKGLLAARAQAGIGRAYGFAPGSVEASSVAEARRILGRPVKTETVAAEQFDRLLAQAYSRAARTAGQLAVDLGQDIDLAQLAQELPQITDLLEAEDDAPIIRLLNAVLTQALREGASDIHIEPYEARSAVRFRIDGTLYPAIEPPRALHPAIVSRIKVMAHLDIAEKRLPQDGRITLRVGGRSVDVRVSTLPAGHGERVVLRLLDKQAARLDLDTLGMGGPTLQKLDTLIHASHGILLVTGPTGSGKTTTLYAALSRLDRGGRNMMTVEDPIEYDLDGISQTQVNPRIGLDFARALRSILRQDPDIIMVGEIRDLETAQIAVQASPHRAPGACDAAYQRRRRRGHAADRHGNRAVPACLQPARGHGAAVGAKDLQTVPGGTDAWLAGTQAIAGEPASTSFWSSTRTCGA